MNRQLSAYAAGPALRASLTVVWLAWLPLIVLPVVDGMMFIATWREVTRDLGLFWLLSVVPVLAIVLVGWLARRALLLVQVRQERADLAAWLLTLGPLVWLTLWQAGRSTLAWVRAISASGLHVSPTVRMALILSLALMLALVIWRVGPRQIVARAVASILELSWLLWAVTLVAAVAVLQMPPRVLWPGHQVLPTPLERQAQKARGDAPDIFLISLDALAAADARACEPGSPHMPQLAAFASSAACFTQFHTASNFTTASTATMETGLLPWTHFATQPDAKMVDWTRQHTVGRKLRERGYRAHFLSDNFLASPLHRGTFESWDTIEFMHSGLLANRLRNLLSIFPETDLPRLAATAITFFDGFEKLRHTHHTPYSPEDLYAAALARLDEKAPPQPVFMWLHTLLPHAPYLPPASTKYQLLPPGRLDTWQQLLPDNIEYEPALQPVVNEHRLRYQESIRAADAALGNFLDQLRRRGRLGNAVVLITSDHGESFEGGFIGHAGPRLDESLVRVPLVIKLSGNGVGRVIRQPTSQADLAPTLLELADAPELTRAEGKSLVQALQGTPLASRPIYSMTMEKQDRFTPISSGRFVAIGQDTRVELRKANPPAAMSAGSIGGPSGNVASGVSDAAQLDLLRTLEVAIQEASKRHSRRPVDGR
jgi:arylsulfatase A-like enzyme